MNQFDNARRAGRETLALIQGGRSGVEEDSPTSKHTPPHNLPMDAVTKDLLDARLETIEVRMDARMARIEDALKSITSSQAEVLASNKSTRTTMIVTALASVLTIVFGVGAFNATVLSNMVASFESGKNTASTQAASEKAITEATRALEAATEKAGYSE